jgi:hypothetical protein
MTLMTTMILMMKIKNSLGIALENAMLKADQSLLETK